MQRNLKKILQTITNSPDNFIDQLSKTEQLVYRKLLGLVKGLDLDSLGNVKPSIANLKKLNEIKTQLSKSLLSKDYMSSVKEYVRQFQVIAQLQAQMYNVDPNNKTKLLTNLAIENTLNRFTGKAYTDTVIGAIRNIIQTSITSGGSYKDLTDQLQREILGTDKKDSIIKRQINSQTTVIDALSMFVGEHLKLITDSLKYEWFRYEGGNITTTREFCLHLTKKEFIHKSELQTILAGSIDNHQCKLNSNGLPLGMKENTNEVNFIVLKGGYNCRHQIYPISKEQVPLHIRMKFEKDIVKPDDKNKK